MKTKVKFTPIAEAVYQYLTVTDSKIEQTILKAINQKVELIKLNSKYGNPISKKLIPQEYKIKYDLTNLFRVELPNFWRMFYTVRTEEIEIIALVIDILDHKKYNRKFGYKKN